MWTRAKYITVHSNIVIRSIYFINTTFKRCKPYQELFRPDIWVRIFIYIYFDFYERLFVGCVQSRYNNIIKHVWENIIIDIISVHALIYYIILLTRLIHDTQLIFLVFTGAFFSIIHIYILDIGISTRSTCNSAV